MTPRIAGVVALAAGFAVMALELTAVRLLAPYFGDSAPVWTNVIGVMLVALAAGAWLGGRLADPEKGPRRLAVLFLVGGLLTALVPLLARPLGGWLLPQDLPLDSAMGALVRGSLVATLLLFAPPVTMIGCMTPILVTSLAARDGRVGPASGMVAALGTLGSLGGTFAATHLMVPEIGSRGTVWLCAALILGCGFLVRPKLASGAAAVLPLVLLPWDWGPMRGVSDDAEDGMLDVLVEEVESNYQYLQVVRSVDHHFWGSSTRLKINEGLDSFHSISLEEGGAFTDAYYDYHAVAPFLAGDGSTPDPLHVLSLGAAAGTFARLFHEAHPGSTVDGVEIDPAVLELGETHFGGRVAPGQTWAMDARVFVERAPRTYDVILVDAYERQIYLPAHVSSREFFGAVARCLEPGGVVSVNSGGRTFEDPVVVALSRTMATVFGEAWVFRVPRSRNFMLLARNGSSIDPSVLKPELTGNERFRRVLIEAARSGAWQRVEPGDPALTDDRPMIDTLQERALARDIGFEGLVPMRGGDDPSATWERAHRQMTEDADYRAALASLQSARAPTPELRMLAGDVRWYLHDLSGAEMEYQAAVEESSGETGQYAEQKLASVRGAMKGSEKAADVASRNGWLALVVGVVLASGLWVAGRGLMG